MRGNFLYLLACISFSASAAFAQSRPGAAYFLRQAVSKPQPDWTRVPASLVPAPLAAAPIPTVRAATTYAPLAVGAPARPSSLPSPVQEPAPRTDLTGNRASPPYDPYQNLPESYRKHTLPAVWAEPLPLQLLRRGLGR